MEAAAEAGGATAGEVRKRERNGFLQDAVEPAAGLDAELMLQQARQKIDQLYQALLASVDRELALGAELERLRLFSEASCCACSSPVMMNAVP